LPAHGLLVDRQEVPAGANQSNENDSGSERRVGHEMGRRARPHVWANNQLLRLLPADAVDAIVPWLEQVELSQGESVFESGDDLTHAYFPLNGMVVGLILPMSDGHALEAATIGREGVIGGIVSLDHKPAFARGRVQLAGQAARISLSRLEAAKRTAPQLHDIFARYTDCLIAQVLQSVGCASVHPLEARYARWLLTMHDRLAHPKVPLTHEALAEKFGVARTYLTRIAGALHRRGAISYNRGLVHIEDRAVLEASACECYNVVRGHFERMLPGLYPSVEH
jgi:CRP-like cAMP-binding protein